MPVVSGQITVTTSPTFITGIPGGVANLVLINSSSAKNIYIGHNTSITTSDTTFLPPLIDVNVPYFIGNSAHSLYAITDSGTAILSFILTAPGS